MSLRVAFVMLAMVVVFSFSGCGSESSETPPGQPPETPSSAAPGPGHVHPSEGPHGGNLIELGNEEYHAELLHDEQTHTVTVHLLDAAGKQPVSVSQPEIIMQLFQDGRFVSYTMKAVREQGDATGAASEFQIVDEALCDALAHGHEIQGRLQVTVNETQYTGTIELSGHEHEGHSH